MSGVGELLAAWYPWLKALHIVAVVAWMAGLLYLPRLYVYHASAAAGSALAETFETMERLLLRGIMTPAMAAVWLFGLLLAATPGLVDWSQGWIWVKLAAVLALSALHGLCARWRRDLAAGRNRRAPGFYRIANEIPALLLIVIVIMVVVRPF